MGWQLTRGELGPCDACTEAKAKQKNLHTKMPEEVKKADEPNGRVYLDITTIKKHKEFPAPTNPNWRMLVDEATEMKFSHFFKTKDAMVEPTLALFYKWGKHGHPVKIVRLDNAGENKLLAQRSEQADWKLNIAFEFTGRATPQQNSRAEVGIATIANKGRALMAAAGCPLKQRLRLAGEAFTTATLLDGLVVTTLAGKTATRYEHWSGKIPNFVKHLRTWGEAGTVKIKDKSTPKVADRGIQCMFVGYALDHAPDCYRMWNPSTNRLMITRDIIWLQRMFYQRPQYIADGPALGTAQDTTQGTEIGPVDNKDEEWEVIGEHAAGQQSTSNNNDNDNQDADADADKNAGATTTRSGRVVQAPVRLGEQTMGRFSYYSASATMWRRQHKKNTCMNWQQSKVNLHAWGQGLVVDLITLQSSM